MIFNEFTEVLKFNIEIYDTSIITFYQLLSSFQVVIMMWIMQPCSSRICSYNKYKTRRKSCFLILPRQLTPAIFKSFSLTSCIASFGRISPMRSFSKSSVWVLFQYKDYLSMYRDFHYKDKIVMRLSHLYNGNSYTGKMTSLYLNSPPALDVLLKQQTLSGQHWPNVCPASLTLCQHWDD